MDGFNMTTLLGEDVLASAMNSTLGDAVNLYQQPPTSVTTTSAPYPPVQPLPAQAPHSASSVSVQLLSYSLKQSQLMMSMMEQIRQLHNKLDNLCQQQQHVQPPQQSMTIDVDRKRQKPLCVPVVIDIDTRLVNKKQTESPSASQQRRQGSPSPKPVTAVSLQYGRGEHGKKMDMPPPDHPAPKRRK